MSSTKSNNIPTPPPEPPVKVAKVSAQKSKHLTGSTAEMHGWMGSEAWEAPIMVTECDLEARPGYQTKKAHEYLDTETVLAQKVSLLADLIRKSKNMITYTGAGLSTAAGINDYATKAGALSVAHTAAKPVSALDALPSYGHFALAALYKAGHLKHWVQQNHDGLPQKAGYPQHAINEIHGAWFDPSNPVVPMSGQLRDDLFAWMAQWELKTDLCLTLGTSLCGMNADRMAVSPAKRALKKKEGALGTVIVGLQCTQFDEIASVRIFSKIDDVMKLLVKELGLEVELKPYTPQVPASLQLEEDKFLLPFDKKGFPLDKKASKEKWMTLNLQEGAFVKLTGGPYEGDVGQMVGKNKQGHYRIRFLHVMNRKTGKKGPSVRLYGSWWLESAALGYGIVPGGPTPIVSVDEREISEQDRDDFLQFA